MNRVGQTRTARAIAAICAAVMLTLPASAADLARLRNGFTIRHEHRAAVGENTRLFLSVDDTSYIDVPTAEIDGFEKDSDPPPSANLATPAPGSATDPHQSVSEVVNSASATYHLDPDLVNSVIRAESGFNTRAVSRKGAQGLMQLMPGTATRLGVADAFDPLANVGGGSRYLRELMERYHFDLVKALAAYNAGPQRVELFRGVPPYRETRAYVARIVHDYNRKKIAEEKQAAAARGTSKRGQPPGTNTAPPQSPR
jgi:soluble lytic murein transglycosylase-like protein